MRKGRGKNRRKGRIKDVFLFWEGNFSVEGEKFGFLKFSRMPPGS